VSLVKGLEKEWEQDHGGPLPTSDATDYRSYLKHMTGAALASLRGIRRPPSDVSPPPGDLSDYSDSQIQDEIHSAIEGR